MLHILFRIYTFPSRLKPTTTIGVLLQYYMLDAWLLLSFLCFFFLVPGAISLVFVRPYTTYLLLLSMHIVYSHIDKGIPRETEL